MSVLVIDVGTSGLRASIVRADGSIDSFAYEAFAPTSPFPGLVEFDASAMRDAVLRVAAASLTAGGGVDGVGITNQRSSTILWDYDTGVPIGPAIGWQDLRTVMDCITVRAEHGLVLAPNQTATKASWMLKNYSHPDRAKIRIGTVDSWVAYVLSEGELHITDFSNAAVSGLLTSTTSSWSPQAIKLMELDESMLPTVVHSSGVVGRATALKGSPPIASLVGDQQSSLIGQGCINPGQAKITFGTGGMLDVFVGSNAPKVAQRGPHGTFPIVVYSDSDSVAWGAEAIMLSAGTNIEWLRDDLQIIDSAAQSDEVAAQVATSDGVVYVPALLGLGTPHWDYGARGSLFGITRGTTRAHIVRAVLEGIAHRGADLVEAASSDTGLAIDSLRIDGGMSLNKTFVQALANASMKPIEVSPVAEATTLGAAFLAGIAVGTWNSLTEATSTWRPASVVSPTTGLDRAQWLEAISRSRGWIPALSSLDF
ncbi:MAG: FGGY-family carbohydrate kinase [Ilumatobacteraceae bacterium]